jgi:hypothetical protein
LVEAGIGEARQRVARPGAPATLIGWWWIGDSRSALVELCCEGWGVFANIRGMVLVLSELGRSCYCHFWLVEGDVGGSTSDRVLGVRTMLVVWLLLSLWLVEAGVGEGWQQIERLIVLLGSCCRSFVWWTSMMVRPTADRPVLAWGVGLSRAELVAGW